MKANTKDEFKAISQEFYDQNYGETFIITIWNKDGEYYITKKGGPDDEVYDGDEFGKELIEWALTQAKQKNK